MKAASDVAVSAAQKHRSSPLAKRYRHRSLLHPEPLARRQPTQGEWLSAGRPAMRAEPASPQ